MNKKYNNFLLGVAFVSGVMSASGANAQVKTDKIYVGDGDSQVYTQVDIENLSGAINGGAVENFGTLNVGDDAIFNGNTATEQGGLIWNVGTLVVGDNATFSNGTSSADSPGIFNGSIGTVSGNLTVGDNASFIGNKTLVDNAVGGGLINQDATVVIGANALFQDNYSSFAGAGIYQDVKNGTIYDANLTVGDGAQFINNKANAAAAIYNYDADSVYTGAVNVGKNAVFKNNNAVVINGARGYAGAVANWLGTMSFEDNVTFEANTAEAYAGAVASAGDTTFLGTSAFTGNTAGTFGGAIAIVDTFGDPGTMNFNGAATFTDNTAGTLGGAIYNVGTINFNDSVTFAGNNAGNALNDIHNNGRVNFANGTTVILDGGITTSSASSVVTFGDNTTVTARIASAATINAGTVNIGTNSILTNLVIDNVAGENIALIEASTVNGAFNYTGTNQLYNITQNTDGTFNILKKGDSDVATDIGATQNQMEIIAGITEGTSDNSTFNTISDDINVLLQSGNPADVKAGLAAADAFAPSATPVAHTTATQNISQVFSAIGTRLSGGISTSIGQSSGDTTIGESAFWVQTIINQSKLSTQDGFKAYSRGLALGGETMLAKSVKAGLGYAYTRSNIKPDLRTSEVDSNTVLAYAEYKPSDWYINGIMSYTLGRHEENKNVAGTNVKAKYDVKSIALQALTGYDIHFEKFLLTPEVGMRYANIKQEAYKDNAGSRVNNNVSDVLTAIIGSKINTTFKLNNEWKLKPEFKVAAAYDLNNDGIVSVMSMANGSVISVKGDALKRWSLELGASITALKKDDWELAIGWEGRLRDHYKDHTGLISVKYNF